jgi:peptide/nickel transport system substrate-binding protein
VRTTKRSTKFASLAVGLAFVAASCGSDKVAAPAESAAPDTGGATETTAGSATTAGATETTAGTATTGGTGDGKAKMRITYDIAKDAAWEDGSPITVADFKCTLDAVMNTPGSLSTVGYDQILSLEAGDSDKQVVAEFSTTYAPYKNLFSGGPGLLKAAAMQDCKDVTSSFDGGIKFSGREWKMESWSAEQIVYVPNDKYTGPRKPKAKKIVIVPAEDGPTLLKAGTVDFIFPQAYTGIDQELADPNVKYDTALGGSYEALYFQQLKGPFADDNYRKAFSMSIDRDALYKQIYAPFAQGTPLLDCGPIAPGQYCEDAFKGGYDPAAAEKLLTDNGWKKGADGFFANDKGEVPEVRWMVNTGNTRRESTQEFMIPLLAKAGFKVKADNCEATPCVFQTRLPSLDYDLGMYINTVTPDPSYLTNNFTCDQIPSDANGNKGQNQQGWCNEKASKDLKDADVELDDAKRTALVKDAIKLMAEDSVLLPTLQFPNVGAYRTDKVSGTNGELANYKAINDFYNWTDVDGDGTIVIGAEQFPASDCANPVTECANSSWFFWMIANPVLPAVFDTTNDQKYVVTELMASEPKVEVL